MSILPESPQGVLEQFALTSTSIDVFSDGVIESVKNGEVDPIKVLVQLRAFEKASERIIKEIRENFLTAADKYPGNEFEFMGNKIQKGDTKTDYDYSETGDTIFERLESEFNTAKERLDARKALLKALKEPQEMVDSVTGEMITVKPPVKKGTPGLKVFIK